jgi:GT2 family glycosyltransferase
MLAHFGTFDVDNYGDLLFPILLEKKMTPLGIKCVHISPTGTSSRWHDALPPVSVQEARRMGKDFTFVMLGGGNTFRADPTSLPLYASSPRATGGSMAYRTLWRSAFSVAQQRQIPLSWNAVGVPRPISSRLAPLVDWGARMSSYISVRDTQSRENLLASGVSTNICVVPDTALGIRDLWSRNELHDSYTHLLGTTGQPIPGRVLAISLKRKYITISDSDTGAALDYLANSLRATPILLALGPCHGDDETNLSVSQYMKSKPVLWVPRSLKEIGACISHAVQYVGSSLHGAITAISFGVPTVIVANEDRVPFRKFSGFLRHIGLENALFPSWDNAATALQSRSAQSFQPLRLDAAFAALDEHWRHLCDTLIMARDNPAQTSRAFGWRHAPHVHSTNKTSHPILLSGDHPPAAYISASEEPYEPGTSESAASGIVMGVQRGRTATVDIVLCVHNALQSVAACVQSVVDHTSQPYKLIIVNDRSDEDTSSLLRSVAGCHGCVLIVNNEPLGYTKAANIGMAISRSEYTLFLNSDTIVSSRWLDKLLECAESDKRIGLVGPLSNAAAYQSVPSTKDDGGRWIENNLPERVTPGQADKIIELLSERRFPRVPFLNGFCLLVKRDVITRVGSFDEVAFPYGYGEEIDYCLRARQAGLELAVADHVYIFHARSKSYGREKRIALSAESRPRLDEKHGAATLAEAREALYRNADLALIRQRIAASFQSLK